MVPDTGEAQRAELHKTIWKIAEDLRGSVDGWDFKAYVLGMLFYRFISENLATYINRSEREAEDPEFEYATLPDSQAGYGRDDTVSEKGFFILPSELFENVRKQAADDPDLNETLALIFRNIEGSAVGTDSEDDLKGLFDDLDVNSAKLGGTVTSRNKTLVKLLDQIGDLPLGELGNNRIDLFGDAYEFLAPDARQVAGQGLSRLLNVCDGVLGQATRILILVTTNEPLRSLHPALSRPGRCLSEIEFEQLTGEEIRAWCDAHGIDPPKRHTASLADLYAHLEGRLTGKHRDRDFGFGGAVAA